MKRGFTANSTACRSGREFYLVIAPNWLGDAVMATPLLLTLREEFPDKSIHVVCRSYVSEIFRRSSPVDGLGVYEHRRGFRALVSAVRESRPDSGWDACFVLPVSFASALAARLSGAGRRYGYSGECRRFLLTDVLKESDHRSGHLTSAYHRLAERAAGRELREVPLPVVVPPYDWQEISARKGVGGFYAVYAPGAAYGPAKVWPAERFSALAGRLAGERGLRAVVVGSSGERAVAEEVLDSAGPGALDLAGCCTIEELLAVLRGASLVVGNDSGIVHISAAMARPTVALFGSTDPAWTAPRGVSVRTVSAGLDCAPCFERECPGGEPARCLAELDVDRVFDAAVDLIEEVCGERA